MEKRYNQDYFFDPDYVPIKLRAEDEEDVQVISTLLQDSLVPSKSLHYDEKEKTFSFLVNRFRWEASAKDDQLEQNERVFAMLLFENVTAVKKENFPDTEGEVHHNLLCLKADGTQITCYFSAQEQLIIQFSKLKLKLRDVSEPWPTEICPIHHPADG